MYAGVAYMRPREGIEVYTIAFSLTRPTRPDVRYWRTIKYTGQGEGNNRSYNDTHGNVTNSLEICIREDA